MGWTGLAASSSSGPAACAAFPAASSLRVFRSLGVCTSASLVMWVGLQPFPSFSGLLLLRLLACWGSWGFAPCVRVLQLRCCLLGVQVRSLCCLSLTLEWVCFWPKVSQVFVGCEGGLGFLCFLPALRPPSGSWCTGSSGFSSPLGFPTFAMGSPLRGRGLSVLDRNEGLVSPFGSGTLVSSWLDLPPLSAGICAPCPSGCVAKWSSLCP